MYEIYCLNMSVWNHKVCLFTSPEKTLACQLHSTGPVTEVAWYWAHVSYSVVNGVSSELCYSLAAKHTDCPLCVHNKFKTIFTYGIHMTSGANGKKYKTWHHTDWWNFKLYSTHECLPGWLSDRSRSFIAYRQRRGFLQQSYQRNRKYKM